MTYKTFCSKPEEAYPIWMVSRETKIDQSVLITGQQKTPEITDKTYQTSVSIDKPDDQDKQKPKDQPLTVRDTKTTVMSKRIGPKPFDKTYQVSVLAQQGDTERQQEEDEYPPWVRDTKVEKMITVSGERQGPKPFDKTYEASIMVSKHPEETDSRPDDKYPPWVKDTRIEKTTMITDERKRPKPFDKTYQTSITMATKKPTESKKKHGVVYPPWMKDTQVDQTTAEEWRKPQSDDQMYQTSVAIPKKPDGAKSQPGVTYPPWMKDTQVDQTTTVTAEEWRKPQSNDQMYQTSVTIPKKPDGAKSQPGVTYPPWMKDTQVDQTTTVTAEEWRKPQSDDQMYQTSVTIPGKLDEAKKQPKLTFPPWVKDTVKDERQAPMDEKFRTSAVVKKKPEVKKKPKVQLPPWIKDTEKTTSVTAEKKVWKPIDKKFQTSVTTTVPLPKEQEKPEDVCPPWVVTDTQIDKRMTITAMGKSMKPEDQKFESSVTITGKEKYPQDETKIVTTEMKVSTFPGPLQKGVVLAEKKFPKKAAIVPTKPKPTKTTETETRVVSPDRTVGIGIHQTDTTTKTVMEKFPLVPTKLVIEVEDLKLKVLEKQQYQVICPYPHEDFMMLEAVFASPWKPSTDSVWEAVIALEQQPMRLETSGLF